MGRSEAERNHHGRLHARGRLEFGQTHREGLDPRNGGRVTLNIALNRLRRRYGMATTDDSKSEDQESRPQAVELESIGGASAAAAACVGAIISASSSPSPLVLLLCGSSPTSSSTPCHHSPCTACRPPDSACSMRASSGSVPVLLVNTSRRAQSGRQLVGLHVAYNLRALLVLAFSDVNLLLRAGSTSRLSVASPSWPSSTEFAACYPGHSHMSPSHSSEY